MKRKIITKKQLDRLVSLGVVFMKNECYRSIIGDAILLHGPMFEELIGSTVKVRKNNNNVDYPFIASECLPWYIPSFILACNYKKMLKKADEVRK